MFRKSGVVVALVAALVVFMAAGTSLAKRNQGNNNGVLKENKHNGKNKQAAEPVVAAIPTAITATVVKVDPGKVTVTFVLPTDAATRVCINGDGLKNLSDIQTGQNATITFSGGTVSRIEIVK